MYEDPTGLLCKLQQRSSVSAYLSEFESLANRIVGLPATFVLSCFISGLSPAIRREVQVLQPVSLVQPVAYARLQEEKLLDARRPQALRTPTTTITPTNSRPSTGSAPSSLVTNPSRNHPSRWVWHSSSWVLLMAHPCCYLLPAAPLLMTHPNVRNNIPFTSYITKANIFHLAYTLLSNSLININIVHLF